MLQRNFRHVILVIAHFIPDNHLETMFQLWYDDLYRSPELQQLSWQQLCIFINSYLYQKYGSDYDKDTSFFSKEDAIITQILQGNIDHQPYLPNQLKSFIEFADFSNFVKHEIQSTS